MRQYTKADLERIVVVQLENLNAMHNLLSIMKVQNELILNANKKLKDEISEFKEQHYTFPSRKKKFKILNILQVGDLALLVLPKGWLCVSGQHQMC